MTFDEYLKGMLLEIVASHKHRLLPDELIAIHQERFPTVTEAWLTLAMTEMEKRGWGKDGRLQGRTGFFVDGSGIAEADQISERRRKKSFRERAAAVPFGKGLWEIVKLSLAAIFGALAKSYFG